MTVRGRTEWQKFVDDRLRDHDKRLTETEKGQAVFAALNEEQRKYINDRFNRIQDNVTQTKTDLTKEFSSIKSGISKVLWAIGLAVVLAIVQFLLAGGVKLP